MSSVPPSPEAGEQTVRPAPFGNGLKAFRVAAAVIWTILILVLCWLPATVVREVQVGSWWSRISHLDKMIHCGIFVVLSILWVRLGPSRRTILAVILGGFALGALSELGQLVPIVKRDANLFDLITDCAGVLIGVAITPLVEPLIQFVERRFFRDCSGAPLPAEPAALKH